VHTDLRAEHVFLLDGEWKLVDLSHALLIGEPLPAARGIQPTRYVAPEMVRVRVSRVRVRVRVRVSEP